MDRVFSKEDLALFLRKIDAEFKKKDGAGNLIFRTGAGKYIRVIQKDGSAAVQSIPGCGSCSPPEGKSA